MKVDSATMARAALAIGEAARYYLYDPNISLIDFGYPEQLGMTRDDRIALRFHVHRKLEPLALESAAEAGLTRPVPAEFFGFPTDVPEATYRQQAAPVKERSREPEVVMREKTAPGRADAGPETTAFFGWGWGRPPANPRAVRCDPLKGGISISNERQYTYGTLGGLVIDRRTGAPMVLSNWHVLAGDWAALRGQRIYQAGRLDGGSVRDVIAVLDRHAMDRCLDAAVARLTGERRLINEQVELGPVRGTTRPALGMRVVKSGRRTGVTYGRVVAVQGMMTLNYAGIRRVIANVITIEPMAGFGEVSAPGDSGSWWLEADTRRAVGLHFAGSNQPETSLANDMQAVLDALDVEVDARTVPAFVSRA